MYSDSDRLLLYALPPDGDAVFSRANEERLITRDSEVINNLAWMCSFLCLLGRDAEVGRIKT